MNTDIKQIAEVLEAEGWSIGTDGRVVRLAEREGVLVTKVNASSPLARVTLDGATRWVSVRDLVAYKHLGMPPTDTTLVSIDGNAANTAVENLAYKPRTGKRTEAQADRAKKAQERAEVLAKKAEEAATKAQEAAQKAAVAAGTAPPTPKRARAAKQAA